MTKKKITDEITRSSGNVFQDLELPNSGEYLLKAELAYQINRLIEKKRFNQQEAAQLLGIDQPKISALRRGRLRGFSVERLFKFLAVLNQDIEIIIKPHKGKTIRNSSYPNVQVKYTNS